jgi:hypothetical protein
VNINWTAAAVIVAIVIALFQGARFVLGKIFKLGEVSNRLTSVETNVTEMKKQLDDGYKELRGGINNILKMLAEKGLAASDSPRKLTEDGRKVLTASGIDAIVDDKYDLIVERVGELKPENPYQAEQAVLDTVAALKNDPVLRDAIEEGAFKSGYFVDSVLFVGGLHIRDRVLKDLGFNIDDIDKHAPSNRK